MRPLRDRLRWMVVPIASYLAITLGLPALHGAAARADFLRHAGAVAAGCALVIAVVAIGEACGRAMGARIRRS